MCEGRSRKMILWGLIFMVTYLYVYELSLVLVLKPTPAADEIRDLPFACIWLASKLGGFLAFLSIPTHPLALRLFPAEPFYWECVYIPFACAFQWFFYGCLFGLWRSVAETSKLHRENQKRTTEN
jgi:hypothetical protein